MEAIFDLPASEYFAREAASASLLAGIRRDCPYVAKHKKPSSSAIDKGSALHCAVLEPHLFFEQVLHVKCSSRGTNIYKDAVKANPDKICLPTTDYETACLMAEGIQSDEESCNFLHSCHAFEVSLFGRINSWIDGNGHLHLTGNFPAKCRWDAYCIDEENKTGYILDIKSTNSINENVFKKRCHDNQNALKASWYKTMAEHWRPDITWSFYWLAIRSSYPYIPRVYRIPECWLDFGANEVIKALPTYIECYISGEWPKYGKAKDLYPDEWMLREQSNYGDSEDE